MRNEIDVIRSLGSDADAVTAEALARAEAALWAEIERARGVGQAPAAARRRRRRRRVAFGVLLPVALLAAGAGYWLGRPVAYSIGVACYDAVSLGGNLAVPGPPGPDPVATCADVWRSGAMRDGVHTAPAQTACVVPEGAIAVFPSGDPRTCARLGLAPLPAGYARGAARFARLQSSLEGLLQPSDACVGADQAIAIARRALAANGFNRWKVRVAQPFDASRPCAGVAFDDGARVVLLVPTPRQGQFALDHRRRFAGLVAPVGSGRSEPIDTSTLALLRGDGLAAVFRMSSRDGRARCVGVLGLGRPAVACTAGRGISWWVLRLVDGTLLLTGTSPSSASTSGTGMVLRLADGTASPLAVDRRGYMVGEVPAHHAGENATLIALAGNKPIATTPIELLPGAIHGLLVIRK